MNVTRLSLDIENGWPVAKPDEKGPLCFYSDASSLLTASEARVAALQMQYEAMREWIQKAPHYSSCRSEWEGLPWEADAQCTCGLSALRASLDTKTRGDG